MLPLPNENREDDDTLKAEIASLETRLSTLRAQLTHPTSNPLPSHPLLHLTDSALPLGTFAFSSGLESYLAHHPTPNPSHNTNALPPFLHHSLTSLTTTTLPYLTTTFANPSTTSSLDDTLDASTLCPVARRASLTQGRSLLTLWTRSLASEHPRSPASEALACLSAELKTAAASAEGGASRGGEKGGDEIPHAHGHFPIVYALVCKATGLTVEEAAWGFLWGHAKGVVSAGVRAGVLGPYAAQGLLGGRWLGGVIGGLIGGGQGKGGWMERGVEEAGQSVPLLDCWMGRHELLYSRIFNS